MGNKPSMEDELINLKMTSRQMTSASKKSVKKEKEALSKVKKAIAQGNTEGARIYAQNAIREKNQQLNYLRLSSRIDAVAARLETAIQTQQISKSMKGVVQGMGQALQSMNVEKISATMTAFEQQFEDMEVITDTISDTMVIRGTTARRLHHAASPRRRAISPRHATSPPHRTCTHERPPSRIRRRRARRRRRTSTR
mmetsp:Transcript_75789/g.215929  ORF Transcript_75789/g.215929 Transcript_75789/m.215929 type:complete len:197 (-) Transcript_75789:139-729(-)